MSACSRDWIETDTCKRSGRPGRDHVFEAIQVQRQAHSRLVFSPCTLKTRRVHEGARRVHEGARGGHFDGRLYGRTRWYQLCGPGGRLALSLQRRTLPHHGRYHPGGAPCLHEQPPPQSEGNGRGVTAAVTATAAAAIASAQQAMACLWLYFPTWRGCPALPGRPVGRQPPPSLPPLTLSTMLSSQPSSEPLTT